MYVIERRFSLCFRLTSAINVCLVNKRINNFLKERKGRESKYKQREHKFPIKNH